MSDYESISKRATPRPWIYRPDDDIPGHRDSDTVIAGKYEIRQYTNGVSFSSTECSANAALIVHCVNHYDALKASHDELVEALRRIEPNIGWRSRDGEDPDQFYCEFCAKHDLDLAKIEHHYECPVYQARAALARARASG